MKLLTLLAVFLFSGIAAATPLHEVVVFGDSLSDNGNLYKYMQGKLPQSPPYYKGRFSNGPVWVEHLVSSYFPEDPSLHLANYAFGGAWAADASNGAFFTLRKEVEAYLLSHHDLANADSLYVVWIGANNYLSSTLDIEQTLADVSLGITQSLELLAERGAKNIVILNLPDLGKSPAAVEFNSADLLSYLTNQHNKLLVEMAGKLKQKYPEVNWLLYDLNKAFSHLLENPQEYGLHNVTEACIISIIDEWTKKSVLNMVASVRPNKIHNTCDGYLFFDLVHPTVGAHRILSDKIREMLDKSGIEFAIAQP